MDSSVWFRERWELQRDQRIDWQLLQHIHCVIDRQEKVVFFERLDKAYVGFEEIGFELESSGVEELQNNGVDAFVDALSLGSSSYNRQSTNETTTTTKTINDERVRCETRVEKKHIRRASGVLEEHRDRWESNVGRRQVHVIS